MILKAPKGVGLGLLSGLLLCANTARAGGWNAMDWIDGWYETSTPDMRKQLGVDRVTINCKNLSIRTTPEACISWIKANPTTGLTYYIPYINPDPARLESNATQFSQQTIGAPVPEIDIDDFFGTYQSWYQSKGTATAPFLSRVIDNLKSVNKSLKFGITLYENELDPSDNVYIDNAHMPAWVRAKFDVVRLFLHYRANGPRLESYVTQAKAMFPNAQIIAGVYGYDRIDYFPCAQNDSHKTPCTQSEELDYFQQALNLQLQLLKQGSLAGLDFYPGYFGAETNLFGPGKDSVNLTCNNVTRCVQNTVAMRNRILSAHTRFQTPPTQTGTPPAITRQPAPTNLLPGQTQIFSVTASGSGPLTYQWRKNGSPISGATQASYHTPPVTLADDNVAFTCLVKNAYGQVTSNPGRVTITGRGTAPVITRQPTPTNLLPGQTQIFSVTASGSGPLSYQWRKNGSSISGATQASYHTPPVTLADHNAAFTCLVKNAYGQVTSNPGLVTITETGTAPVITRQPTITQLLLGQTQIFSVTASGSLPLSYQWRKNGSTINGATQSSYHTPPAAPTDNKAQFTCVVSNPYGSVTSLPGTISLVSAAPADTVATQGPSEVRVYPNPWRSDRHGDQLITFTHVATGSVVKIFTASAHTVKTLFTSSSSVGWNRKNESGDSIASGLYIYLLTNDRGQQVRGQFAVIK